MAKIGIDAAIVGALILSNNAIMKLSAAEEQTAETISHGAALVMTQNELCGALAVSLTEEEKNVAIKAFTATKGNK